MNYLPIKEPVKRTLINFKTEQEWSQALVNGLVSLFDLSQKNGNKIFHMAVSGGQTPRLVYEKMSLLDLPWEQIVWWLCDERYVAENHSDSNQRMIRQAMGSLGKRFQFQSWNCRLSPEDSAVDYEQRIKEQLGDASVFDLVLLGLGEDGHTASLFPGSSALSESTRLAVANPLKDRNSIRLTLTYPLLNRSAQTWYLVGGKNKSEIVQRFMKNDPELPASRVSSKRQSVYFVMG